MTGRELGEALRVLGITRQQAATLLNVSLRSIQGWISEEYPVPRPIGMLLEGWIEQWGGVPYDYHRRYLSGKR